jgi:uncharacterized protein YjbJ (UPF0337 family)
MSDSLKDEVSGKMHELKGDLKEKVGQVTNNPRLEEEGKEESVGGTIEKKVGQIKKVFEP